MEISNIYALIWLGLKIVYLYYLPIEISIYKSNKTTSIVNGSSITSQEAQSGNLARISVLMYIIVQICHKIYILKWNLLVYLIVCVLLFIFLFCWTNINFQRLICSLHLMFAAAQCGKFVLHNRDIRRAMLMLSIYLLLNFRNLSCAISKLSSQGGRY